MTLIVATAAELDALPVGSIVLSPIGSDYRKGYDDLWHSGQREWSSELMFEPWISGGPFVAVRIPNRDLIAEARAEGAREALALIPVSDHATYRKVLALVDRIGGAR